MPDRTASLADIALFQGLEAEALSRLDRACERLELPAGSTVISQEDQSTAIFFVLGGGVVAKSYSAAGREVTYDEIGAGGFFGEFSAIDEAPRSAFVQTLRPSLIASMSAPRFRAFVGEIPLLGLRLCEHLVAKSRRMSARIYEFSTMSVRDRLCAELLRLAEGQGRAAAGAGTAGGGGGIVIDPAPSHYELSTRLSTHREAVSREMSRLAGAGIVKAGRQKLVITDPEALRRMVAGI